MGAIKVLISGATGSFGQIFLRRWLDADPDVQFVVFSRDEHKQYMLYHSLPEALQARVRFMLGDVRDSSRLQEAMQGTDVVVHTAALKQVQWAEQNPEEVQKTNVMGTLHVVEAAQKAGVKRVFHISTDKAVNPVGVYGRSKQEAEALILQAARDSATTQFSILRFGNLVGSRGSVIPLLLTKQKNGSLQFTDPEMTRFHATADDAWALLSTALAIAKRAEVFIPKLPAYRLADLAQAFGGLQRFTGSRPGEKAYEELISETEAKSAMDYGSYFIIHPDSEVHAVQPVQAYHSQKPYRWLTVDELRAAIADLKAAAGEGYL